MTKDDNTHDPDEPSGRTAVPREATHHVVSAEEVAPGERVLTEIRGREVAVFNVDGEFHALANYCPHQGGPIAEGKQSGAIVCDDGDWHFDEECGIVACPWHGWEFDVATGEHLAAAKYRVPTYEVDVVDGEIYVRL